MISARLEDRIDLVFEHDDVKQHIPDYLSVIRENWRQAEQDERRTLSTLLVIVVAFELLVRAVVTIGSWQGFEFSEPTLILLVMPAVAAFYYYQMVYLMLSRRRFERAHRRILKNLCPLITDNRLELLLHPHFLPTLGELRYTVDPPQPPRSAYRLARCVVGGLVFIVGPVWFLVDAYWRVLKLHAQADRLFWVMLTLSALVALAYVCKAILYALSSAQEG